MGVLGPYGRAPGISPPYGAWESAFPSLPDDVPTDDWEDLERSGYTVVYGVLIDGIPVSFGARKLLTVTGDEAQPPSSDYTQSNALVILPDMTISIEPDRQKGLAAGRSFDLLLGKKQLEDEDLLTVLFKKPTLASHLAADVEDPTATVFTVDEATGNPVSDWPVEGTFYVGREFVRYTAVMDGIFAGCTRGVAGMPHYHSARGGGYRELTDTPRYFKGRHLALLEHLCGPDGRYLGTHWNTVGTYCREAWYGYIDSVPLEHDVGKHFRCLPIVRKCAQEVGAKLKGTVAWQPSGHGFDEPILCFDASDVITVRANTSVTLGYGPHNPQNLGGTAAVGDGMGSLALWCLTAGQAITDDITTANAYVVIRTDPHGRALIITVQNVGATIGNCEAIPAAWFLTPGVYGPANPTMVNVGYIRVPVDFNAGPVAWVVLSVEDDDEADAADWPDRGFGVLEVGGEKEFVRWDKKRTSASLPGRIGLRLIGRGANKLDPWAEAGATVTLVSGFAGTWPDAFQTMVTSSGTGARGDHDTAPFGFGLGIPADRIDLDTINVPELANVIGEFVSDGRVGIEGMLCGWLALNQKCLVQRRNAAGKIVLAVVDTDVAFDPGAIEVDVDDVLLGGHGAPEVVAAPNLIKIDTTGFHSPDVPKETVSSQSRIDAEGVTAWEIKAPGEKHASVTAARELMVLGDGQATLKLEAPPWSRLQPGDRARIITGHPRLYDYINGAYAPDEAHARSLVWSRDLVSRVQEHGFLLSGGAAASVLLCPSATIILVVSGLSFYVAVAEAQHFAPGDAIVYYSPGNEASTLAGDVIDDVDYETGLITLTVGDPFAIGYVITFAEYASCQADQQGHMFVRDDKDWT